VRSVSIFAAGLLLGLLIAIGITSRAQDWLVISGAALHLDGGEHCNSMTTGLALERGDDTWRKIVGFYRNSNCRWSAHIAQAYTPLHLGPVHLGGLVGAVTGYAIPIMPAAGLAAAIEGKSAGINLVYIPPFKASGNVLWAMVKVRW